MIKKLTQKFHCFCREREQKRNDMNFFFLFRKRHEFQMTTTNKIYPRNYAEPKNDMTVKPKHQNTESIKRLNKENK